jgi:hypothetical protein
MLARAKVFWMGKHRATRWSVGLLLLAAAAEPISDSRWGSSLQLALLVGAIPLAFHGISKDRERMAAQAEAERDATS